MTSTGAIGLAGLGTMGRNLGLHALEQGLGVTAFDPWPQARSAWRAASGQAAADDVAVSVAALPRPRRILVLLKAGAPTDAFLDELAPHLAEGDVVADLGNAHWRDTEARQHRLSAHGVRLLGIGISGGAVGARTGASLMAGGDREAWQGLAPVLELLAARTDSGPASAWFGPGGAGHFVKMVHNGIEYADMQALAEAYMALRDAGGLDAAAIADEVERWNAGWGESYLTGLAASVLRKRGEDGEPLIDRVLDEAGQKGTGRWTTEAALDFGVAAPTLAEAVFARSLSAHVEERGRVAKMLGPVGTRAGAPAAADLGEAVLAARICAFAQGFALIAAASEELGWKTDLAAVADVWRAGCILRSAVLPPIAAAYRSEERPPELIAAPTIAERLAQADGPWRRSVAACQASAIPVPVLGSALAYRDGWRSRRLGANLIAAQRDAFGAHGFRRLDEPGSFHADWDDPA